MNKLEDGRSKSRRTTLGHRIAASNRTIAGRLTFFLAAITPGYFVLVLSPSGQSRWVLFAAAATWFVLIVSLMLFGIVRVDRSGTDPRN